VLEICKAFLNQKIVGQFKTAEVADLKKGLKKFIEVCDMGLACNRELAKVCSKYDIIQYIYFLSLGTIRENAPRRVRETF